MIYYAAQAQNIKLVAVTGTRRADISAVLRPTVLKAQRDHNCTHERHSILNNSEQKQNNKTVGWRRWRLIAGDCEKGECI